MSAQTSGKAAKPVASSVHFPRITKHDLEVVVEAMDKLRAALRQETGLCPSCSQPMNTLEVCQCSINDTPAADVLEAQCRDLILENSTRSSQVGERPSQTFKRIGDKIAAFIRTRDRELVELAEKWEKENSLRSDDSYRYPQQLRAVLAARKQ